MALLNVNMTGEIVNIDKEAATNYSKQSKIIAEGDYTVEQVYNVNETALFWKCKPTRTLISQEVKFTAGFKASKNII